MIDLNEIENLSRQFAERDARDPERYPAENVQGLIENQLLLAPFPRRLGGRDWSLAEAANAIEIVARGSPSTALLWAMPLGLAGIYALGPEVAPPQHRAEWGDQIDRVVAEYRKGRLMAACNSEKGAGGSLAATKAVAERASDGRFRLTGEKILASFGRHAHMFFSTAKVSPEEIAGAGVVEFFLVRPDAPGVQVLADWDGFGMRSTESQTVRYNQAIAEEMMGFPNFIEAVKPLQYWYCLFAAIPLGCAGGMLSALSSPAPETPAMKLRLNDARMRYEALRAYLMETSHAWRPAAGAAYAARVLRTKTYVTQEATKLCAELFALGGGRHYRRTDRLARLLADSFAGTALRPPLPLGLETLAQDFPPFESDQPSA